MKIKITHLINGIIVDNSTIQSTYKSTKLDKIIVSVDNGIIQNNMNHSFPNCKFNKDYRIQIDILEE